MKRFRIQLFFVLVVFSMMLTMSDIAAQDTILLEYYEQFAQELKNDNSISEFKFVKKHFKNGKLKYCGMVVKYAQDSNDKYYQYGRSYLYDRKGNMISCLNISNADKNSVDTITNFNTKGEIIARLLRYHCHTHTLNENDTAKAISPKYVVTKEYIVEDSYCDLKEPEKLDSLEMYSKSGIRFYVVEYYNGVRRTFGKYENPREKNAATLYYGHFYNEKGDLVQVIDGTAKIGH